MLRATTKRCAKRYSILLVVLLSTACGGGSSGSDSRGSGSGDGTGSGGDGSDGGGAAGGGPPTFSVQVTGIEIERLSNGDAVPVDINDLTSGPVSLND